MADLLSNKPGYLALRCERSSGYSRWPGYSAAAKILAKKILQFKTTEDKRVELKSPTSVKLPVMSGCLDGVSCPTCDIELGEKRNMIASIAAGSLVCMSRTSMEYHMVSQKDDLRVSYF